MTGTEQRRRAILALLSERELRSQKDLSSALSKKGHRASQPVLSRDLRALKVAKRDGSYQVLDELRVTPLHAMRTFLRDALPAEHFVLVFCEPGAGSAVARAIDAADVDGILGTVAGDDTVLVALATKQAAKDVRRHVKDLIAGA